VTVDFHSYGARGRSMASSRPLTIGSADSSARLEVSAPLGTEKVDPKAELDAVERAVRPSSSVVAAASVDLDVLPPSDAERRALGEAAVGTQIHQMTLQYKFGLSGGKDGKEALSVMPRVQSLHDQLYDSPLDSMLWRLQDANGATLAYGGAIHDAPAKKLKKGSYTVDLLLRHPDPAQLEALKNLPLLLRFPLSKPLACSVYGSRDGASSSGHGAKPISERWLRQGGHQDLYVAAPSGEGDGAVPKWVAMGDVLTGELLLNVLEPSVSSLPLVYEVPPHPAEKAAASDEDDDEGGAEASAAETSESAAEKEAAAAQEDEENLAKKILEASLKELSSLRTSGASTARYEKLSTRLLDENSDHLPLLLELLDFAKAVPPPDEAKEGGEAEWRAARVGEAAGRVMSAVDESELALYFGRSRDDTDVADRKAAKKEAKERGEQRAALRSALLARASAYAPPTLAPGGHSSEQDGARFKESVAEMKAWLESADAAADEEAKDALALTLTKYELAMGRPGSALSLLRKRLGAQTAESKNAKAMATDMASLCRELGLEQWATKYEESVFRRFPVVKLPL